MDTLYHLHHPFDALREYVRCLRPGGLAVVNVPAYRWPEGDLRYVLKCIPFPRDRPAAKTSSGTQRWQ
jgi:SAM-dependent methyltransferase